MKKNTITSLCIWGGLILFIIGIILNWTFGFLVGVVAFLIGNIMDLDDWMDSRYDEDSDSDSDSDE